jgi:restriction system protein
MPVPDFQTIMLPLLELAGDGQEHSISEAEDALAVQFNLSQEERRELLPSGGQTFLYNRVGWARTHLKKAGLLVITGRGRFQITDRGKRALSENPERINMKYLKRFPEYVEWHEHPRQGRKRDQGAGEEEEPTQTPQERLEVSYQELRASLAQELLERIKESPSKFFENLVIDLLVAMGYGGSRKDAAQAVGRSGDEGIDGIIKEDRLGLDVVYVQAKRWENPVGRPVVQSFAGSLAGHHARKGIFITTSRFSVDAIEYVKRLEMKIVLIDGEELAGYMMDHGVGVAPEATYVVNRIDLDYFGEGE